MDKRSASSTAVCGQNQNQLQSRRYHVQTEILASDEMGVDTIFFNTRAVGVCV